MLFAWALVAGLWTFVWALCAVFSKQPFTRTEQRSIKSKQPPYSATTEDVPVRTMKYFGTIFVFVGGIGLIVLALLNYRVVRTPAEVFLGHDWTWYVRWILPGAIMAVILAISIRQPSVPEENSRTNYIDAMKTLITAAGLTVGFITANLKPSGLPQPWIDALKVSTISLVGCVVCAVTTLFAISILYDYARSKNKVVHWAFLLFFALPEAYFAVAFFFSGFINLIQLSKMVKP